jgi:hypothetical protein
MVEINQVHLFLAQKNIMALHGQQGGHWQMRDMHQHEQEHRMKDLLWEEL